MSGPAEGKVLPELGVAFKGVADLIKQNAEVPTAAFTAACERINPIFGHLGMAFKFARDDFVSKVRNLLCAHNTALHYIQRIAIAGNQKKVRGW